MSDPTVEIMEDVPPWCVSNFEFDNEDASFAIRCNGKLFYVDDSEQRNIRVYDFHPDGTILGGRIFGQEPGGKDDGVPDGMKLDEYGNIFVTGPKGVWVWDAEGHHLGTIEMPEQPANLAWGDKDYGTLYLTATTSVYRLRTLTRGFVPYLPRRK